MLHVKPVSFDPSRPLWIGWDFGWKRPAWIATQYIGGQFRVLRSLLGYKTVLKDFAKQCFEEENRHFKDAVQVLDFGDIGGISPNSQTGQSDIITLNKLLEPKHRFIRHKKTVRLEQDHEVIRGFLTQLRAGAPCFIVDPSNHNFIEGLRGGYHYHGNKDRICGCGQNEFFEKEDDYYKHLQDCARYIIIYNFGVSGQIKAPKNGISTVPPRIDKRFRQIVQKGVR